MEGAQLPAIFVNYLSKHKAQATWLANRLQLSTIGNRAQLAVDFIKEFPYNNLLVLPVQEYPCFWVYDRATKRRTVLMRVFGYEPFVPGVLSNRLKSIGKAIREWLVAQQKDEDVQDPFDDRKAQDEVIVAVVDAALADTDDSDSESNSEQNTKEEVETSVGGENAKQGSGSESSPNLRQEPESTTKQDSEQEPGQPDANVGESEQDVNQEPELPLRKSARGHKSAPRPCDLPPMLSRKTTTESTCEGLTIIGQRCTRNRMSADSKYCSVHARLNRGKTATGKEASAQ